MARTPPSRVNLKRITDQLRVASRKGDRAALTLALEQMRTLALSPRYWEKYLGLLRNPLARLVDLLVIKQGERIAHQKGWKNLGGGRRPPSDGRRAPVGALLPASPQDRLRGPSPRSRKRLASRRESTSQPSLFD
jgi:hypothetical protein